MKRPSNVLWRALLSLKLTIVCLVALMALVVACTLAQVDLGTWGAVDVYIRSWLVWGTFPGTSLRIPVMPGGALVGLVLLLNLVASQATRLERSWKKVGIWLIHIGLVLLVIGEFVTGTAQRETRMTIEEGQTISFVESPRDFELALVDVTDPAFDDVYSVAAHTLARRDSIEIAGTPISVVVREFHTNAELAMRGPTDPPALATAGIGVNVKFEPRPPVAKDDEVNQSVAIVEPFVSGQSLGVFLLSNAIARPEVFRAGGRTYELSMRNWREYLPYSLTLKDFRHDVYTGTQIPKNFASLVQINHPARSESREVLIYMNQPLRYEGKAFYQSSFGKNDTLSILQVVENPGWLMPYISTLFVTIGLLVHFWITFRRSMGRRAKAEGRAGGPAPAGATLNHTSEAAQ